MARESILVVEDDKIIAMELRARLQRWGFIVPATAATGEDAIALTLKHNPHLVLMDIWLQGPMDGIQAAEQIHQEQDTPIIYVTANADESTLERAKRTEPYGYVLKPFEELELRTTIEIALYKHSLGARLKESEQWLSTTLTSIGDAVVATDEAGAVTFINPVATEMMKVKREDVLGKNLGEIFRIVDESTHAAERDPAMEVLADGNIHQPKRQPLLQARLKRPAPPCPSFLGSSCSMWIYMPPLRLRPPYALPGRVRIRVGRSLRLQLPAFRWCRSLVPPGKPLLRRE